MIQGKLVTFLCGVTITAVLCLQACQTKPTMPPSYASFDEYPVYEGNDLGLTYTGEEDYQFKLWAPTASAVRLQFYAAGEGGEPLQTVALKYADEGVWEGRVKEDLQGQYYAFQVELDGKWSDEVPDPYVRAVGVNGMRGHIIDWAATNPEGWGSDERPALNNFNEIIIYELHMRDLTIHPSAGSSHPGKYLGIVEEGTTSPEGWATGLDHLKEMGITHVHLIPVYDHRSIDETRLDEPQYNWGYDPQNYNVPEGSYSSDPYDGAVRIKEFKQMVKIFHDNGIRVILDVVYNHTGLTENSVFNTLVPDYYYRQNDEGGFSDASACGNETASERPMMRKFMRESMQYWVEEYHLDGFRVDLMGIHDIETMNEVSRTLHEIDPTIFIYGEGWKAGDSPLPDSQLALKANTAQLEQVAAFSDDLRDGIKGSVFVHDERGFVSGQERLEESIKFGIAASVEHPQVDYAAVNYSDAPWSPSPAQTMTYVSCHDNHTLWDRLVISTPNATEEERIRMHQLAGTIILTSQGVTFLHAGVEMLRTKFNVENSYNSPDSINQIIWSRKAEYGEVVDFYKNLIAMRKAHPAFRMTTAEAIRDNLEFTETDEPLLIRYSLDGAAVGDEWSEIIVMLNGASQEREYEVPEGTWHVIMEDHQFYEEGQYVLSHGTRYLPPISATILVRAND